MKVLHILKTRPSETVEKIIEDQSKKYEVKIVDLTGPDVSYDCVIDDIFSYDKVISW